MHFPVSLSFSVCFPVPNLVGGSLPPESWKHFSTSLSIVVCRPVQDLVVDYPSPERCIHIPMPSSSVIRFLVHIADACFLLCENHIPLSTVNRNRLRKKSPLWAVV